jgi:hypothetical protein
VRWPAWVEDVRGAPVGDEAADCDCERGDGH